MNPRVGIGLPLVALKRAPLVTLIRTMNALGTARIDHTLLVVEGAYIDFNRIALVDYARTEDCTHLAFMDHDMVFDGDTYLRLLAHDKDIVAAPYNVRGLHPRRSTVLAHDAQGQRIPDEQLPTDALYRADGVGCGCMLVKLAVFDKLEWPPFDILIDPVTHELLMSEDIWFCNRARNAGFDVWIDPTIHVDHLGDGVY